MTSLRNIKRLIPAAALLCLAALAACSPDDSGTGAPSAKRADNGAMAPQVASAPPDTWVHCPEGNDDGRRLNDLAEHVHDAAVSEYLRQNVVVHGRKSTPSDGRYAMMLLDDDASYELCITVPERCLRTELRRTESKAEREALLSSQGAYAYERALACLQRAGDDYLAREPEPANDPADLDAAYRERVLPHLVGIMMPVALLSASNFFGADNEELHQAAVIAWHDCYDSLESEPLDPERPVARTSRDAIAALECASAFHKKTWGQAGSVTRPPAPP